MLTTQRRTIAATIAALAFAAPSALASPADLRTPDARDAGQRAEPSALAPDQRSPDARDSGAQAQPVIVEVDAPVATGFDWTAAVIGAGGALAIAVISGAGIALMRRRSPEPAV